MEQRTVEQKSYFQENGYYIRLQSVPFKPNYSKSALDLDMNRNLVADLMV